MTLSHSKNIYRRKGNGDKEKKFKAMERRYNAEKKNAKTLKQNLDAYAAELAVTKRKLMSSELSKCVHLYIIYA